MVSVLSVMGYHLIITEKRRFEKGISAFFAEKQKNLQVSIASWTEKEYNISGCKQTQAIKNPREIPAGDARRSLSERNKILELPRSIKESLPGPFAVVGLGISNLPLIDFLLAHGATVVARDRKSREELAIPPRGLRRRA